MADQIPGVGEDVTALMGGDIGEDVIALMASDDKLEQRFPGLRAKLDEQDEAMQRATTPALAAAGGFAGGIPGAALGGYVGRRLEGGTIGDGAWEAGKQAAIGTVVPVAMRAAGRLVEPTRDLGTKLILSYVKPRFSELQKRAGIEGSTPTAMARNMARFIFDNRLTTADKAGALVKQSGQQADDAVAQAEAGEPGLALDTAERIPRYLNAVIRRIEKQILPGKDRAAVQNVGKELVEDSPLSRSTFRPRRPETLEAGLARGTQAAMKEAKNARKPHIKADIDEPSQFTDAGGAFPKSSRPRELRTDVKPSEGMEMVRTKSYFDPASTGGQIAGGKAIERAVRDAVKQAVPGTRVPLRVQGRAMDAQRLLERGEHLAQNRDTGGGFAQTMAFAGNMRGLLAQMLKEGQLRLGAGAAPRIRSGLESASQGDPAVVQALLAQLMASHGQE